MNAPLPSLLDLMQRPPPVEEEIRSPQTVAADPRLSVFVTANAGSGKTTTLVNRVARLLLRGAAPEALLCVTYTKAAAAEMQTRLFQTLGEWAVMDDEQLAEELLGIGESAEDLSKARRLFARALETPGGLKIQTIHAFCEKLLRRFPLEAGVSPGFQVLEDAAAADVSRDARDALARHALRDSEGPIGRAYAHFAVQFDLGTFEGLFKEIEGRREAISGFLDGFHNDLGAVERHVWAACGFPEPGAPEEWEHEAVSACDLAAWARAAERLMTSSANDQKLGRKLAAVAACAKEGKHGFADCFAAFANADGSRPKSLVTKGCDAELRAWLDAECDRLHEACAVVYAARVARDTISAYWLARGYISAYETAKARTGALDFADLVARTRQLLTERSDAAWVLYKLDGGIDHVLVDEAQDTAPEQWEILRALTGEFFVGHGARGKPSRTIFVVGDEKQSIYSFQGAQPERLHEERKQISRDAAKVEHPFKGVDLIESWRSTSQVLQFVDELFADPSTRAAVPPPPGADVVRHTAGRPDDHLGCVDLWECEQEEEVEEREAWEPVDAEPAQSARKRLARKIACWIKGAGVQGEAVWDKKAKRWRPVQPGDVLILVRRRESLFEEILRALKKAGVPVAGADRLKLSEHIVFEDILALCRFALFTGDDLSLAELLRSPFCDVGEEALYDLAQPREGRALWSELNRRADERPEWRAAVDFLRGARDEARGLEPFEFLARTLNRTDTDGRSIRQRILTRLGREAEDALDEILVQALSLEGQGVRDLERFTAALERSEVEVKRELESGGGAVRVMTVHGAKGLEAPVVILPDTTTRPVADRSPLIPTYGEPVDPDEAPEPDGGFLIAPRKREDCEASSAARAIREAKTQQEALRLLYVALTRARDRLIVCGRLPVTAKAAERGSWYAVVQSAFQRPAIQAGSRSFLDGDTQVTRFGPDPQIAPAREGDSGGEVPALPDWAGRAAPADMPALAYASPSELGQRKRGPAPSPLSQSASGLGRFRRGDIIHRLLQLLPDLPASEWEGAAARLLAKERDLAEEQRAEMAQAALGVLRDPVFAEVFGPGSRAEAAIAGTAPDLPPGLAVSGRVDRMTVTPERVLVVDFKTNRPAPATIEAADEAYRVQMAVYVAVLRAIFPGREVEAALVWTDGPRLMPVPEEVIAQTLASLAARS